MKNQTAVEYLIQYMMNNQYFVGNDLADVFEEAKAMEEKQMIKFAEFVASYTDKNKNANGEMLHAKSKYDGAERTIDLFEQYYNKVYEKSNSN